MSPPDLTKFCAEWLQSWTGNRPDQLLTFYAEDAFYSDPVHPLGLRGHSEIAPYFQKLLAKNPDCGKFQGSCRLALSRQLS